MAETAEIYHLPPPTRRQERVNSWKWNEIEEDALADLPHEAQILYLRVIRKHMDYATGITGEKRRISYAQMQEVLSYKPSPHSGEKPVEYSRDQIKRLVQRLVKAGLIDRLHCTEKGVAPMIFHLPMASIDHGEPRHESATATAPHKNPHGRASGKDNRATRPPHGNDEPRHPSGSGNQLLPEGSNDTSDKPKRRKWGEEIDHTLTGEMVQVVSSDLEAPVKHNPTTWANEFRLMRERDGRTVEQIRYLIAWTAKDRFWSTVILSPGKLREKWDQLAKQVKQQHHSSRQTPGRHSGLKAPDTSNLVAKGDGTYEF